VLPFLFMVPLFASLVVGGVFVLQGDTKPVWKWLAIAVFALAVYLQFFTRLGLPGLFHCQEYDPVSGPS